MGFNRPMTLEEKTQRVMREQRVDWHAARRILAARGVAKRAWLKRQREAGNVPVAAISKYAGPTVLPPYTPVKLELVPVDNMSAQDTASIEAQARYLREGREAQQRRQEGSP